MFDEFHRRSHNYFDKSRTSNVAISIPYSNYSSILTRFRDVASYWPEKNREHKLQCRSVEQRQEEKTYLVRFPRILRTRSTNHWI